jgi:hypothetical protein
VSFGRAAGISITLLLALLHLGSCARQPHHAHKEPAGGHDQEDMVHHEDAVESMASVHRHQGPHMKWTALRPPTPQETKRGEEIVQTLRRALAKYQDHRVAVDDGFEPFLPHIAQPRYHFTRKWYGFKAAFRFDPAEPTSLLYKKTPNGYELIGAMYTAPKRMSEEQLNERIPLSVAQWHAHVNICLPPKRARQADWTKFGLKGSIAMEEACRQAGGRWYPQIFGWMVHVYPFEETPEKIWTH